MKRMMVLAAAATIAFLPLAAQAQALKARAQKVVATIGGDKAKMKVYCELMTVGEQLDKADEKKDEKAVDALAAKMDALEKQLGPDYTALMDGLQKLKQDSKEAQEVGDVLGALEDKCK
jgi:hypothetical protein